MRRTRSQRLDGGGCGRERRREYITRLVRAAASWGWGRWRGDCVCVCVREDVGSARSRRRRNSNSRFPAAELGTGAGVSTKMRQALVQEGSLHVCSRHALTSGHRLRLCRRLLHTTHAAILEPSHLSFQSPAGPLSSTHASGTNRRHGR